ncbi:MAG: osmotically inducible protein OsmC [Sphingobacteriales bacterium 50-39]|nr:OsmC family protein [Sphingobacteriales bacterium]OJW52952.1 MAG: osmotically inducible protein OsmC [Sphingobacteriales bacterium 50-39]
MDNQQYYEVALEWEEGRKGLISSPVLNESIEVATPPEFPKGVAGIWSPEHLLVAAVDSCLMTTFLAVAENSGLEFIRFESRALGKLEKVDGKYLISEIQLSPRLQIKSEVFRDKALKVLEKSEAACLISNSVKARIVFKPEILVKEG